MNSEERHNVIMQYEEVIIRSRDALDILKNLEAQADTKRENVVRLVPNKPDEDSE